VALYVLAFTDTPLDSSTIGPRRLEVVVVNELCAICERRAAAPAASEEELREQHALVLAVADRVSAILPVRFGALLGKRELVALVRTHEAAIRQGLETVRDRVQMTLRILGTRRAPRAVRASSGRDYLEQRMRAASSSLFSLPQPASTLLAALRPMVALERREPGVGQLLATVYHLIDARDVPRYTQIAKKASNRDMILTGPWPPFAFTPQLW
jgi:hypothetical protein